MTNRELYQFVSGFSVRYGGKPPDLETYLRALYTLAIPHRDTEPTVEQFARWLEAGFTARPAPFEDRWLSDKHDLFLAGYDGWQARILFLIADLRRMAENGQLSDPQRYFGINAPSGARWYNFDTMTFLECGVRGSFGGYEADDVTILIPSPDGNDDSPVYPITDFGWAEYADFLGDGMSYE